MTPQEKAKELIEKYRQATYQMYSPHSMVKQCALIAVEEMINEQTMFGSVRTGRYEYWHSVKQEIE